MIAVVGRACRLPGADSVDAFWTLLRERRCAVSQIPADRWALDRLFHPRQQEKGRSYTWAAGVLDDIWSFEPGMFGLSPREADQMDPQQRLLLELTHEAFEDAGLRPSRLAGTDVGVFVGASSTEHGNLRVLDPGSSDAYTATGNALSIASNRISYAFDLRGPSLTLDTACSSSLVALNEAMVALRSGRIGTAVVGGVNVLANASAFVTFSQAGMLSRRGLCQAFSSGADGYVRSEGGVVLVLKTVAEARAAGDRVRCLLLASDVNSDGRTSGIALPSRRAQTALLESLYARAGVPVDAVSFIEAHGTGTPVGDPIEAGAIGDALGRGRSRPLPLGSVKSNIGHTEPAAGLAGLLKAMLALEYDYLPASLHCEEPNPDIPFADLNLSVCVAGLPLPRTAEPRIAGVNSFGFGGTNAHVILTDAPEYHPPGPDRGADLLVVSAATRDALRGLATRYAMRLSTASPADRRRVAAAAFHRRDRLGERLILPSDGDAVEVLAAVGRGQEDARAIVGSTVGAAENAVAFVYSGNGSQWVGMGRAAYAANAAFRSRFDEIDRLYHAAFDWSPREALHADDLAVRLPSTSVAQPLIFAIQAASTFALAERGLVPDVVLGHSVGEVAAAEAAGVLDLVDAVAVIHHRSRNQEATRHLGSMAVISGAQEAVDRILAGFPGIDIAAFNGPRDFTLAGPTADVEALVSSHAGSPANVRRLDLDYPFHSRLMTEVEGPIRRDLAGLRPRAGSTPIISTVTGAALDGRRFGADYWWHNIREPVRFRAAMEVAAAVGARIVVEVGPRPTLLRYIADCMGETPHAAFGIHARKPAPGDPIGRAVAIALSRGARVAEAVFGDDPGPAVDLPATPWHRTRHRLDRTVEASTTLDPQPLHPLAGARVSADALTWTASLDTLLLPGFADHRVGSQVLLPGSGFIEMAFTAARQWLPGEAPALRKFEILAPLVMSDSALRDAAVRITPGTRMIEILSRRRLAPGPWQLHARVKIVEGAPSTPRATGVVGAPSGEGVAAPALYALADAAGLHYGPTFRLATSAVARRDGVITVDLDDARADPAYALDPMRLDACFHGLALVFADLCDGEPARPFIPVRFEDVRLVRPGATVAGATIEIIRKTSRGILADFSFRDSGGQVVAEIRGAQFHPMRLRRSDELARHTVLQRLHPATALTAKPDPTAHVFRDVVLRRVLELKTGTDLAPAALMLEGWATARSFEIAHSLAAGESLDRVLDPVALARTGRIGESHAAWLSSLLAALAASGLATGEEGRWRLRASATLPRSNDVLRAIAEDHPDLSVELPLAARISTYGVDAASDAAFALPSGALDAFELRGAFVRQASETTGALLAGAFGDLTDGCALRVLQLGSGPLSRILAPFVADQRIVLTVLEPDPLRLERARLAGPAGVSCVAELSDPSSVGFHLIVASGALSRFSPDLRREGMGRLVEGGLFLAVEPAASLFRDLVCGIKDGWFAGSADAGHPAGMPDGSEWSRSLAALGFAVEPPRALPLPSGAAHLILATGPSRASDAPRVRSVTLIGDSTAVEPLSRMAALFADEGISVSRESDAGPAAPASGLGEVDAVVFLAGGFDERGAAADRLARRCLALERCVARLAAGVATLWIVCPGATRPETEAVGPVQAGVWAFARTLSNERPGLDIRRVDAPTSFGPAVAGRLRDLVLSDTAETEVVLDAGRTLVVRIGGSDLAGSPDGEPAEAVALDQATPGVLDGLRWRPVRRTVPGPGEVEIAVQATGLNFRDVLFALSMLPDDVLQEGFAGPSMGLECAGRVLRVGDGVTDIVPGDDVVAFARSGFATHVTVPSALVAPAPAGLAAEAAATIPVAFMTAYHGLVTQARLRRRETVLIHGAAGGVGLAAIQIAKRRGARVIGTAGSPERRALALALGADHAFDSRSLTFVDDVRALLPDGVDVVLNSLAGEAMEESLGLLKPFGRFVELGKRDYIVDTHVGLRPFRHNLSYFGVDLDQLLLGRPEVGRRLLRDVMGLFRRGALMPLPYERFASGEVSDAFRLMQHAGHVGKIVVAPPAPASVVDSRPQDFRVDPDRTHVVTGAFGGFGAETVRWLADAGARHLLLLGRRGAQGEAARALVDDLESRGVAVAAPPCDITDREALAAALTTPGLPPLAGIVHAAMVLDDGLVANIDRAQIDRVLAPKVVGADLLDALTRATPLDYFVLFSSATTLIGNPGQGSYVAANAYIEAVARRRRGAGLPAVAIAWGAIEDVGVLNRQTGVKDRLASRIGIEAMKARDALDLMAAALTRPGGRPEDAVLGLVSFNWGQARDRLAVLRSPTYAAVGVDGFEDAAPSDIIDLAALAASGDHAAARRRVADAIADDVAHILRLPRADVALGRPLSDLGLDSLMLVELAAAMQARFVLVSPPPDLAGSRSILDLSGMLLGAVDTPGDGRDALTALARRHLGDAAAAQAVSELADGRVALSLEER